MPDRDLNDAVLEVIRERLVSENRSESWLAAELQVNVPTLHRQLRGTGVLTLDTLAAIAPLLGWEDLHDLIRAGQRRV